MRKLFEVIITTFKIDNRINESVTQVEKKMSNDAQIWKNQEARGGAREPVGAKVVFTNVEMTVKTLVSKLK